MIDRFLAWYDGLGSLNGFLFRISILLFSLLVQNKLVWMLSLVFWAFLFGRWLRKVFGNFDGEL